MKNFYCLFFIIYFTLLSFAKNPEENYQIIYPKNIPVNSSFDISLITTNSFPGAEELEIYIFPEEKLLLKKTELRSIDKNSKLSFFASSYKDYIGRVFKTSIDLTDTSLSPGTYFQILFSLETENQNRSSVKFAGIFKQQDSILGYLHREEIAEDGFDYFITADLRFYKPHRVAGSSVLFNNNSFFEISFKNLESKNLLAEFWLKLNDIGISFLKIKHKENPSIEYKLSTNSFQMLLINSTLEGREYLMPYFIGKKSWYHIAVNISPQLDRGNYILFYCDGILIGRNKLPNFSLPKDFIFEFVNVEEDKTFQIDLLRFIDFKNSIEASISNRNYINFRADSSNIIEQFRFDNTSELTSAKRKINLYSTGIQFVKSDAPIFAKAPELNISLLTNSYELEWTGGDYKQANTYVLEKSTGVSEYIPLFTIQAENSTEKVYRYLDKSEESFDIVYYRLKQINIDGTVVYSSQVKIGQGLLEPFTVEQNYPNPFNPKTSIEIELLEDSEVEVIIYNLEGQKIETIHKGFLSKGTHKFAFDGTELPSGIYLYKIATPNFTQTRKMILTK